MGVITVSDEFASPVPPARLFKALILDSPNLIPKLMPRVVKSIDVYPPEGGVGSIRQINFVQGNELGIVKNRVEELNEETFTYKYSLVEAGPILGEKIETIVYEAKFVDAEDGGSVNKMTSTYYTKGEAELSEEEIKSGKEKALGMYKLVEAYLIENPEAYA